MTSAKSQRQILRVFVLLGRIGEVITAAHGVKQHVGEMACIVRLIAGQLDTVILMDDPNQSIGRFPHRRLNSLDSALRGSDKMYQLMYRYSILTDV